MNEEPFLSLEQAQQLLHALAPELRLVRMWPFAATVNSQVVGLETEHADGLRCTLVLRQYGPVAAQAVLHLAANETKRCMPRLCGRPSQVWFEWVAWGAEGSAV